jgi:chromosome segregation ATPase
MTGKASVSFDKYKEIFRELTAQHKKPPTVKEMQRKLGGGSTELLGKYRTMLLLEQDTAPQALVMKPTLARAIQVEMDDVRNLAVAALNETLRVEREECKMDFERIEMQNAERDRSYVEALEHERDQTRRAMILVEERGHEIDRLRTECTQHQEARRVAEVEREKAVAVSEAELAGIERERKANETTLADLKTDLKSERDARHQSEREQATIREGIAVLEQKNYFLQLETQRFQKCEEAAAEVPTLRAVNKAQVDQISDLKDAAKVMSDLDRVLQGEIHRLREDFYLAQRQRDEYKGRAEVAEKMQLEMMKGADGA